MPSQWPVEWLCILDRVTQHPIGLYMSAVIMKHRWLNDVENCKICLFASYKNPDLDDCIYDWLFTKTAAV